MSLHHCLLLAISLLLVLPSCTLASGHPPSKPIVTPITKDGSTSLYTIPIKSNAPLVLDLAGSLVWSTCPATHRTIPCRSGVCSVANRHHPPNCPYVNGGRPGSGDKYCTCVAYPYSPVNGQCGYGDLTVVPLSANATDGKNPLFPVSFSAVASCSPDSLLASLPSGAAGVAGLSRWPLSLPSQVASSLKVAKQFALCLPGVAIFGGGPFYLLPPNPPAGEITNRLTYTTLLKNPKNAAYYLHVTGIAVNQLQVPLPPRALDLDIRHGQGGVMLSTVTPYTALRTDVYRALLKAFDAATSGIARAPAPKPFELCYQASALSSTRLGFGVAQIDLMLEGGRNWPVFGANSLVQVSQQTVCFAFVEMGPTPAVDEAPAVIIGGYQMENNLLVFDVEKGVLGYSALLFGRQTTCMNFNFTMGSA